MKTALCVLLSLLLVAPAASSQAARDTLIVPGGRVGPWTLEMALDDLVRMNGPATTAFIMAGHAPEADAIREFNQYAWPGLGIAAITFDRHRIEALVLVAGGAPLYKTAKGIGLQSGRADVVTAYGTPTAQTTPQQGQTNLIYDELGAAFRVQGGTVRAVYVFRPGTARRFWQCAVTC